MEQELKMILLLATTKATQPLKNIAQSFRLQTTETFSNVFMLFFIAAVSTSRI